MRCLHSFKSLLWIFNRKYRFPHENISKLIVKLFSEGVGFPDNPLSGDLNTSHQRPLLGPLECQVKQETEDVPDEETWWRRNFPQDNQVFSAPSHRYIQRYQEIVDRDIKHHRWRERSILTHPLCPMNLKLKTLLKHLAMQHLIVSTWPTAATWLKLL